jgi:hypothetical protein
MHFASSAVRRAGTSDDPLEAEFAAVICALEQALTEEAGNTKRLNRIRPKLGRVGIRKTLADLALKRDPHHDRLW